MADSAPWEDFEAPAPWKDFEAPKQPEQKSEFIKGAINSLPAIGGVAGGILGTPADAISGPMGNVAGAAIGGYLGTAAKNLINHFYDPASAPKSDVEAITSPLIGGAEQGAMQGVGEVAAPIIAKGVSAVAGPASNFLKSFAAKKAISATGATGKQAAEFAPNAGQELLDRGIVKFGRSQEKIAEKAAEALDASGNKIGSALSGLDGKGAFVEGGDVASRLRARASELAEDPSQFGVSDQLNKLADRISNQVEQRGGSWEIPLTKAETTKRGFQQAANYNSVPLDLSLSKEAANVYRQAVEDAATKADPKLAEIFQKEKADYGLLSPITKAAQKRAMTTGQSPHGGLLDTVATVAGEGAAGPAGAVIAPIARRQFASRSASSMAAAANKAGNMLRAAPQATNAAAKAGLNVAAPQIGAGPSALEALAPPMAAQNEQDQDRKPAVKGEKDPQIQSYAKTHKLTYDMAEAILRKRGYGR